MKTSSIRHPENNSFIQVHEWQIRFCQGNHCAALLLGFFSGWHDWKLKNNEFYLRVNEIEKQHSDELNEFVENAYLFFNTKKLIEGTLGFYRKDTINDAIELLISIGVLSVHQNPDPKNNFYKTKYYKFYPNVCNEWINSNYPINTDEKKSNQAVDFTGTRKVANRSVEKPSIGRRKIDNALTENRHSSAKNLQPSSENRRHITNTTNHTTNHNQSIQLQSKNFPNEMQNNEANEESADIGTQQIIEALITLGMSPEKFTYPDILASIQQLLKRGATLETFARAFDISVLSSKGKGFGMNYLVRVVESELQKLQKLKHSSDKPKRVEEKKEPDYESDFSNAMDWAGDIANLNSGD